jgi:hypothetical protein
MVHKECLKTGSWIRRRADLLVRSNRANPNVADWAVTERCLAATSSTVWLCGLHADMPVMSPMHAEHAGQWILFIHGFKWITRPIDTATGRRQVEEWKLVSRYSCYVMANTSHNLSQTSIKRTDRIARGKTPTILDSSKNWNSRFQFRSKHESISLF